MPNLTRCSDKYNKESTKPQVELMEFFATADMPFTANELQRYIRIENLPLWCNSIQTVLSHQSDRGNIYCSWGEFAVHQEILRDGVRFTLPGCPNALQWTITADGDKQSGKVVVHCTINSKQHDADFIEALQQFVDDWKSGLEDWQQHLQALSAQRTETECAPWYG